jgi:DNA-binding NtrC family response regulator
MPAEAREPDVVIIDDEIQIRRLLRVTLESEGFSVRD